METNDFKFLFIGLLKKDLLKLLLKPLIQNGIVQITIILSKNWVYTNYGTLVSVQLNVSYCKLDHNKMLQHIPAQARVSW